MGRVFGVSKGRGHPGAARLVWTIARDEPRKSLLILVLLLVAGVSEGLSVSTLLPVLNNVEDGGLEQGLGDDPISAGWENALTSVGLPATVEVLIFVFVVGLVLKGLLVLLVNRQVGFMVAQVATDLRTSYLRALLATRWQYFAHQPLGKLANAAATEAQRSALAFMHGTRVIAVVLQVAILVGVMLMMTPVGGALGLGAGFLILFVLSGFVRKSRKAGAQRTERMKSLVTRLADCLGALKVLKAMGRERAVGSLVEEENARLNKSLRQLVFAQQAVRALKDPLLMIFIALGIYFSVKYWAVKLTLVIVSLTLIERVVTYMGKIQRAYQRLVSTESAYWSLRSAIREAEAQREAPAGTETPSLHREIRLEGVALQTDGRRILDGIDMTIGVNQLTCIVGPSGAGKTTLADVVTGLLVPDGGRVVVDDTPLPELDQRSWRRSIGYVPQETLLLHDTLLANVTLGDPDATSEDVEWALRAAGAWDFVKELEDGLQTSLGERGSRFSGGQRQRISVARALLNRPRVLILDEATSALDAEGEAGICETLRSLSGQFTILAIAHTRALMEAADVVYHVERGRIVKRSTAGDLLADGIAGSEKIS